MHSNLSYLNKLKPHIIIKSVLSEGSEFEFIGHTIGFEGLTFMPITTRLHGNWTRFSILGIRTEAERAIHSVTENIFSKNNDQYIYRRSNFVTLKSWRKSWLSRKNSSIDCKSATQIRWNKKRLFNSNTGSFSRSKIEKKKKNKLLIEKIELTYLF